MLLCCCITWLRFVCSYHPSLSGGGDNDGGDMGGDKPIPAKVESGGRSGGASLIAAREPISSVPSKMDDPTSQVVKKPQMDWVENERINVWSTMYLNNAYAFPL